MSTLAVLVIGVTACVGYISFRALIRDPFHLGYGLVALCVVLYLLPAILWSVGGVPFLEYAWGKFDVVVEAGPLAFVTLSVVSLVFGCWFGQVLLAKNVDGGRYEPLHPPETGPLYSVLMWVVLAGWVALIVYILSRSGLELIDVMLPSRKDRTAVYGSIYVVRAIVYIPLVAGYVVFAKGGSWGWASLAWFALATGSALGTGQRRQVILVVLFAIVMSYLIGRRNEESFVHRLRHRWKNLRVIIQLGLAFALLSPVLWWLRNFFSQIPGRGRVSAPWDARGFVELVFGSPATGFPAGLATFEVVRQEGVQWFYSIAYSVIAVVPRALWADKPKAPSVFLQETLRLEFSPSLFFLNDLYLNFGGFALVAGALWGGALTAGYVKWARSRRFGLRTAVIVIFANLPTLFKNGMAEFLTNSLFIMGLAVAAYVVAFRLGKRWDRASGPAVAPRHRQRVMVSSGPWHRPEDWR